MIHLNRTSFSTVFLVSLKINDSPLFLCLQFFIVLLIILLAELILLILFFAFSDKVSFYSEFLHNIPLTNQWGHTVSHIRTHSLFKCLVSLSLLLQLSVELPDFICSSFTRLWTFSVSVPWTICKGQRSPVQCIIILTSWCWVIRVKLFGAYRCSYMWFFFSVLIALHTGAGIYRAALSNLLTLGLFMDYSLDKATTYA